MNLMKHIINRRKFLGLFGCGCCSLLMPSCSTVPITDKHHTLLSNNIKSRTFNPYQERIEALEKDINNEFTNMIRTPAANEYLKVLHQYLVEYYPPNKF